MKMQVVIPIEVGGEQRELVGSLGAIQEMLNVIKQRLAAGVRLLVYMFLFF